MKQETYWDDYNNCSLHCFIYFIFDVVDFLEMTQDYEETVGSFSARLRGQAAVCDFTINCSLSSCGNPTSYMEKMVAHQLTRGLADSSIQEEVLAHAAQTPDMDLDSTLKLVEAKETGKRSGNLIAAAGGNINRLADRSGGRRRSISEPPDDSKCLWCNLTGHGRRASQEVRKSKCKAFGQSCKQCKKKDHYQVACRSSKQSKPSEGTNNSITFTTEAMSGNFCSLRTLVKKGKVIQTLPHHVYSDFRG